MTFRLNSKHCVHTPILIWCLVLGNIPSTLSVVSPKKVPEGPALNPSAQTFEHPPLNNQFLQTSETEVGNNWHGSVNVQSSIMASNKSSNCGDLGATTAIGKERPGSSNQPKNHKDAFDLWLDLNADLANPSTHNQLVNAPLIGFKTATTQRDLPKTHPPEYSKEKQEIAPSKAHSRIGVAGSSSSLEASSSKRLRGGYIPTISDNMNGRVGAPESPSFELDQWPHSIDLVRADSSDRIRPTRTPTEPHATIADPIATSLKNIPETLNPTVKRQLGSSTSSSKFQANSKRKLAMTDPSTSAELTQWADFIKNRIDFIMRENRLKDIEDPQVELSYKSLDSIRLVPGKLFKQQSKLSKTRLREVKLNNFRAECEKKISDQPVGQFLNIDFVCVARVLKHGQRTAQTLEVVTGCISRLIRDMLKMNDLLIGDDFPIPKGYHQSLNQSLVTWVYDQIFQPENKSPLFGKIKNLDELKYNPAQRRLAFCFSTGEDFDLLFKTSIYLLGIFYKNFFCEEVWPKLGNKDRIFWYNIKKISDKLATPGRADLRMNYPRSSHLQS